MFAVVLIALAIVGFSYATWFSSVVINGTATVGSIDLQHYQFGLYNQTTTFNATVGYTYPDVHTLTLTISPVYEGWTGFMWVNLTNAGNLPLKFYSFQMTYVNDPTMAGYFNLGFVAGYPHTVGDYYNVGPASLTYYSALHTYEGDWSIPAMYITLQPGAVHNSLISLSVPSIPSAYMGASLVVQFTITATLAS